MLEMYSLKQNLHTVRMELANTLYQHDAACRVIARLIKERDAARSQLTHTEENIASAVRRAGNAPVPSRAGAAMEGVETEGGITDEIIEVMKSSAKMLSKNRKNLVKQLQGQIVKKEKLKKYQVVSSHPLHSSTKPGLTCLDIHPTEQDLVCTGGNDATAIIFNRKTGKILDTLKAHKKKVNDVKFHATERSIVTSSADNTACIWTADSAGKFSVRHTIVSHSDEVVGSTIHPSGHYLITASKDKTWAFHDLHTGACRQIVAEEKIMSGYTRVQFHPDGLILGAGTEDSLVRIFNVQEQKNVANFKGHNGPITGLSFSEKMDITLHLQMNTAL